MALRPRDDVPSLGFLTVLNQTGLGCIGGYLLLNAQARPLEFHCTAPVAPNRAQEILYGPTLQPYLYEQIGIALVKRSKQTPRLLLTDCHEILPARTHYPSPLLFVEVENTDTTTRPAGTNALHRFCLKGSPSGPPSKGIAVDQWVCTAADHPSDQTAAEEVWNAYGEGLDWSEPFDRIREAISEAQRPAAA